MKLVIGSDHGAVEMKALVKSVLVAAGHEVEDLGCQDGESVDYPVIGAHVSRAVSEGRADRGVLLCGTGIGMSLVANRFPGVRGTLVHDAYTARMSREHNDSNMLVLGGRVLGTEVAKEIVSIWLSTPYEGGRHQRRLDLIHDLEPKE